MRLKLFFLFASLAHFALAQTFTLYPGDTNADGVANHYDLLPIGIAFGSMGELRDSVDIDWEAKTGFPWNNPPTLPVSEIPLSFVDCNGDGIINEIDLEAIKVNFDETQNDSDPPPIPYPERLNVACLSCPSPDIVITFDQDTVGSLDTFSAFFELRYPPNVLPEQGALGIVFNVEYNYDPDKIIDSLTKVFPFDDFDDRMYVAATHTEVVTAGLLPAAGSLGLAAAGKGQNVFFSPTPLFRVDFVIIDMIVRDDAEVFSLSIDPTTILILNEQEQIIKHGNILMDSVVVSAKEVFQKQVAVKISPNPARETLSVESPESPMEKIEIHSLAGERVFSLEMENQNRVEVPVTSLPPGVWLAVVQTKKGVAVKKFVKQD